MAESTHTRELHDHPLHGEHSLAEWAEIIDVWCESNGWNEGLGPDGARRPDRLAATLALIHSEVSEAVEAVRTDGGRPDADVYMHVGKPEGLGIELADVVIRVLHLCARLGIDLEAAISMKMDYNLTRERRHGGLAL